MRIIRTLTDIFLALASALACPGCAQVMNKFPMQEQQITNGLYGHMLNSNQVFSPDGKWVVYDTRNDQTHINRTCCIEKVSVETGEVVKLYEAPHQTLHGPGVGAASWHPRENRIIFIHGLLNCDESNPYTFTRRFGAVLEGTSKMYAAEARSIAAPLVPGALRGGTHAHSWSADGQWISFTYNDFLIEQMERRSGGSLKDLRTIGVMSAAEAVTVSPESAENFSGRYFAAVAATVIENPRPGSDEIEKAFDECWVGTNGYTRMDGSRQKRAIAFQGHVRTRDGSLLTEIFVSDIPDDITRSGKNAPLQGTLESRPGVPLGLVQRRVSFTESRKFPGVQGPRHWVRSSPDGSSLYFLAKDDDSLVQVFAVPVNGGEIRKVSSLPADVQAQFNVSPDGKSIALIADNSVWIIDITSGTSKRLTVRNSDEEAPVLVVNWDHTGNMLVYNKYVGRGNGRYLQIFKIQLN